jgi:hypothetical protein
MGDITIIRDYQVEIKPGAGRSGNSIMVSGGSWRVPPEFSGTLQNNWLTRIFVRQHRILNKLVTNVLREELRYF